MKHRDINGIVSHRIIGREKTLTRAIDRNWCLNYKVKKISVPGFCTELCSTSCAFADESKRAANRAAASTVTGTVPASSSTQTYTLHYYFPMMERSNWKNTCRCLNNWPPPRDNDLKVFLTYVLWWWRWLLRLLTRKKQRRINRWGWEILKHYLLLIVSYCDIGHN